MAQCSLAKQLGRLVPALARGRGTIQKTFSEGGSASNVRNTYDAGEVGPVTTAPSLSQIDLYKTCAAVSDLVSCADTC